MEGPAGEVVYDSMLQKFTKTGDPVFGVQFPEHQALPGASHGDANAAPNILRINGEDIVLALALYWTDWHLVAFSSTNGQVLADTVIVHHTGGEVIQAPFCAGCGGFWHDLLCGGAIGFCVPSEPFHCTDFSMCLPDDSGPRPGIAVWQDPHPQGSLPTVVVSDGNQDTVGYVFDPVQGFTESFRVHDGDSKGTSPPMVLADGHSAVGKTRDDRGVVTLARPNPLPQGQLGTGRILAVDATPTQLADGRVVVVERHRNNARMSVLSRAVNQSTSTENRLMGDSMASAAAS